MLALILPMVGDTADVAPNAIGGAQYLALLIGTVIPVLVGLITFHTTSAKAKALVNLAAVALTGFLTEWFTAMSTAANFDWQQALVGVAVAFIASVGTLYGFYKPTGVDNSLKNVGQKNP